MKNYQSFLFNICACCSRVLEPEHKVNERLMRFIKVLFQLIGVIKTEIKGPGIHLSCHLCSRNQIGRKRGEKQNPWELSVTVLKLPASERKTAKNLKVFTVFWYQFDLPQYK